MFIQGKSPGAKSLAVFCIKAASSKLNQHKSAQSESSFVKVCPDFVCLIYVIPPFCAFFPYVLEKRDNVHFLNFIGT